jgi:hypothetical protein
MRIVPNHRRDPSTDRGLRFESQVMVNNFFKLRTEVCPAPHPGVGNDMAGPTVLNRKIRHVTLLFVRPACGRPMALTTPSAIDFAWRSGGKADGKV